jgi:DNA polymerase-3 subunit gamma/tau
MRDSQSLFDQLLAFSTGEVSADDVHRLLGTAPDEQLLELFQAIAEHRPGEVLTLVDRALGAGVQPAELLNQSISYVRDWMVTLSGGGAVSLASVAARHRETLQSQAAAVGMTTALAAFQILAHAANQMFRSTFARIVLEMALVQLSLLENLSALSDLLSGRLTALPVSGSSEHGESAGDPAGDRKKKLEPLTPDDAPPSASTGGISTPGVPDEPVASVPSPIVMELTPGDCPELLDALRAASGLRGATGLKQAEGLRFAPPNVLEILLPASGEFARKVLEQPDIRGRLESEASRLTGRRMAILLKTVGGEAPAGSTSDVVPAAFPGTADATQPVSPSTASETVERRPVSVPTTTTRTQAGRRDATPAMPAVDLRGQVDPMQDPFVRQVIEVFGATPVRITTAPVIRDAESGDA